MTTRRRLFRQVAGAGAFVMATACGPALLPRRAVPVVGFFPHDLTRNTEHRAAFLDELSRFGFVDGTSVRLEWRLVAGDAEDRAYEVARELIAVPADVLVTNGGSSTRAAKRATETVPVVFITADPVEAGLIKSLPRPGGNITGVARLSAALTAKRLDLLKEIAPNVSRIAIIGGDAPEFRYARVGTESAARNAGFEVISLEVTAGASVRPALDLATIQRADALISLGFLGVEPKDDETITYALSRRIPALYGTARWIDAGGLAFYGPNAVDNFRRAGNFVGRILQGANPADMPIEAPATFDLIINLKTAAQIGVSIPPALLKGAARVVE